MYTMRTSKIRPQSSLAAAVVLLLGMPMLCGCFGGNAKQEVKVQEPPYIPALPAPPSASDIRPPNLTDIRAYADLMEMGDSSKHHPKLVEALSNAIRAGVLKPTALDERFEPDRGITFGEFRSWTLAWQTALAEAGYGIRVSADGKLKTPRILGSRNGAQAPRELNAYRRDSLDSPMNPDKLMLLPEQLSLESKTISPEQPLTRETLCELYVYLTQQTQKVRTLSPEAVEGMSPGGDAMHADEALSQFKDYGAISPEARPYVALAYKDRMLQKIFRLTPDRLTVDDGFHPQNEVSREEAILLLDHLYGRYRVTGKTPKALEASAPSAGVPATAFEPGVMKDGTAPQPVASKSTFSESGPGYSRKSSKITVP